MGYGLKYSGIIGYQANISDERHNLRAALGLLGISAGYDYKLSNHLSVGVTTGEYWMIMTDVKFHTVNLTYHISGHYTQGWNISFDTGVAKDTYDLYGDNEDYFNISYFSLGYTF